MSYRISSRDTGKKPRTDSQEKERLKRRLATRKAQAARLDEMWRKIHAANAFRQAGHSRDEACKLAGIGRATFEKYADFNI